MSDKKSEEIVSTEKNKKIERKVSTEENKKSEKKVLTDEQLEKRRAYYREYNKKRYHTDPEWKRKQIERDRNYKRYQNDPESREKWKAYKQVLSKKRYEETKKALQLMRELQARLVIN